MAEEDNPTDTAGWHPSPELNQIGLDWIGLDWIGLDWIGLDWIGLDWIDFDLVARVSPLVLVRVLSSPRVRSMILPRLSPATAPISATFTKQSYAYIYAGVQWKHSHTS